MWFSHLDLKQQIRILSAMNWFFRCNSSDYVQSSGLKTNSLIKSWQQIPDSISMMWPWELFSCLLWYIIVFNKNWGFEIVKTCRQKWRHGSKTSWQEKVGPPTWKWTFCARLLTPGSIESFGANIHPTNHHLPRSPCMGSQRVLEWTLSVNFPISILCGFMECVQVVKWI